MKFLILPALVVAGLATSVSGAFADGNTPDFYAIQRNEPYAGAWSEGAPPAEVAPMQHRIVHRAALPAHRQYLRGQVRRPSY